MIVKVFHLLVDYVLKIKLKTFTVYYFEQFTSVLNRIREEDFFLLELYLVDLGSGEKFHLVNVLVFANSNDIGQLELPLVACKSGPIELLLQELFRMIHYPVIEITNRELSKVQILLVLFIFDQAHSLTAWANKQDVLLCFEPKFVPKLLGIFLFLLFGLFFFVIVFDDA